MPLIIAKCTNCGGILEVNSEKDAAICPYCNSAYIVEKAINNYSTTFNISSPNVNLTGPSAEDFIKKAQSFEQLGAYKAAADQYIHMMKSFPDDPRGATNVVRLAAEHHTKVSDEINSLDAVNIALRLGNKEFFSWFCKNFYKDDKLLRSSVCYIRKGEFAPRDTEFIESVDRYYEKICKDIRIGMSSLDALDKIGSTALHSKWVSWDQQNKRLQLYCSCIPSVASLLKEAQDNADYFNSECEALRITNSRHDIDNRERALIIMKRLWGKNVVMPEPLQSESFMRVVGIVGNSWCDYDTWYKSVEIRKLPCVLNHKRLEDFFNEYKKCTINEICPYCGIGKRSFWNNKCKSCGMVFVRQRI